ncbi:MAG: flagellar export chaperone FliS [Peptococcaceae bacterium]|jgi:flagellar protein FliS|nr:flagellar export chaperone FliS [Peptococcaceae bacterium]
MALGNPYDQYRQQQIASTPSDKILLMLYDGAVRFCEKAKVAIQDKDVQEANNFIIKVERIVEELRSCLDMSYEISHNLYSLYDYMYNRLMEANLKKDVAMLDEVSGMLAELRETWGQAVVEAKKVQDELKTEDSYQTSSAMEKKISAGMNQGNSVVSDIQQEAEPSFGIKTQAAKKAEMEAMMAEKVSANPAAAHINSSTMASYRSAMMKPITAEDAAGAAKLSISSKPAQTPQPGGAADPSKKTPPGFMKKAQMPISPGSVNFES